MKSVDIKLSSIQDVRTFVENVIKFDCDIDLASGRYIVDAKSIMGIFSLDLMKPITMTVHSDKEAKDVFAALDQFIIK